MATTSVKEKLLVQARIAFIEKGYKGVSMRYISEKSEMALGNIYYYFESKDALFRGVLQPVLEELEQVMLAHNSDVNLTLDVFEKDQHNKPLFWHFADVVKRNREELYLLFFNSEGSELANYSDVLVSRAEAMGHEYLNCMKNRFPHLDIDITPFFMRIIASTEISIMKEWVSRTDLEDAEFKQFAEEFLIYTSSGWRSVLKVR